MSNNKIEWLFIYAKHDGSMGKPHYFATKHEMLTFKIKLMKQRGMIV